jgi:hypothetical protein
MLSELDVRGNQASGFAFQSKDGSGFFKQAVAGSKLNLRSMNKATKVAILHTRYATHGSIRESANNHPVLSPDRNIALVHNGVIFNHKTVRGELPFKLPEVDSSVIPAIIQNFDNDFDKFSMLDGDAAVAWLDENDQLTLRVARISHSPLTIGQSKDGSFFFASTETILRNAVKRAGVKLTFIQEVPERSLMVIRNGVIDEVMTLPATDPKYEENWGYDYGSYRSMTSGKKPAYGRSNTTPSYVKYQSAFGDVEVPSDWLLAGDEPRSISDDFPEVEGLSVNLYGEYFDRQGTYVGSVEDLLEWGYIDYDGITHKWDDGWALAWNKIPGSNAPTCYENWD